MPLSATALSDIEAWVARYAGALASQETATVAAIQAAFRDIDDWSDTAQTIAASLLAVRIAEASRQATAGLSAQYAATVMAIMLGRPQSSIRPDLLQLPLGRRGVEPFDLWSRPVHEYRRAIARGATDADAFQIARVRAEVMALMDMSLAQRVAAIQQLAAEGALSYRRVIRPELSRSGTCGLCIAASDQTYSTADLMPLHERCKCVVLPIVGDVDPGFRLNESDLGQLYEDAGSTAAAKLKRTRYRIEEHGELGPILVNGDHVSRGTPVAA